MIPVMGILYGPRDAVSVLMGHGHRVSLRPSWQQPGTPDWDLLYVLDGQQVTLAELEDAAEIHEKLRGRYTTRRARLRLRSASVVTDLTRLGCGEGGQPRLLRPYGVERSETPDGAGVRGGPPVVGG